MYIFKNIYKFFCSLSLSLWLLALITILFIAGAVIMPSYPDFSSINIPLFKWLEKQALAKTWWLWGCIGLLAVFAVNTLFCSVESIMKKRKVTHWLLLISPQIIHIGFLFILLAHLLGAMESYHIQSVVYKGQQARISESEVIMIENIDIEVGKAKYLSDWQVDVAYLSNGLVTVRDSIRPNDSSVHNGLNFVVKEVYPEGVVLQMNRDPGAVWALAGGILFSVGILILIVLRIRVEK